MTRLLIIATVATGVLAGLLGLAGLALGVLAVLALGAVCAFLAAFLAALLVREDVAAHGDRLNVHINSRGPVNLHITFNETHLTRRDL